MGVPHFQAGFCFALPAGIQPFGYVRRALYIFPKLTAHVLQAKIAYNASFPSKYVRTIIFPMPPAPFH